MSRVVSRCGREKKRKIQWNLSIKELFKAMEKYSQHRTQPVAQNCLFYVHVKSPNHSQCVMHNFNFNDYGRSSPKERWSRYTERISRSRETKCERWNVRVPSVSRGKSRRESEERSKIIVKIVFHNLMHLTGFLFFPLGQGCVFFKMSLFGTLKLWFLEDWKLDSIRVKMHIFIKFFEFIIRRFFKCFSISIYYFILQSRKPQSEPESAQY